MRQNSKERLLKSYIPESLESPISFSISVATCLDPKCVYYIYREEKNIYILTTLGHGFELPITIRNRKLCQLVLPHNKLLRKVNMMIKHIYYVTALPQQF